MLECLDDSRLGRWRRGFIPFGDIQGVVLDVHLLSRIVACFKEESTNYALSTYIQEMHFDMDQDAIDATEPSTQEAPNQRK